MPHLITAFYLKMTKSQLTWIETETKLQIYSLCAWCNEIVGKVKLLVLPKTTSFFFQVPHRMYNLYVLVQTLNHALLPRQDRFPIDRINNYKARIKSALG